MTTPKTFNTIGFAGIYFTLWHVTEPQKVWVTKYEYVIKQEFTYIKNLSMDFEKAKAKLIGFFEVDLSLKGESSFERLCDKGCTRPDNVFAFGKYTDTEISECTDNSYIEWYYDETSNSFAKDTLLNRGYIEHDGGLMTIEQRDRVLSADKERKRIDSLSVGHHFDDKKRVELSIKEVDSFSFESYYSRTHVVTYETDCGKIIKYMGANPPSVSRDEFTAVKATVKHDRYNDLDETKIQRIKVQ